VEGEASAIKETSDATREVRVPIHRDRDVVAARQEGRALASLLGFSSSEATLVATAISELARNIVLYAKHGEVVVGPVRDGTREGVMVVARDEGPGIPDIPRALAAGHSTSGGLGLGLPGISRCMDELHIESEVGKGTTVVAKKWKGWSSPRSNGRPPP